ncbi:MAG: Rv1355c family protein [Actinomycetota bacterium]
MFDTHSGSVATFWAQDASVFATAYIPEHSPEAWRNYIAGLVHTYDGWGVGQIVDPRLLEDEGCSLFWLLHDLSGRLVGGIRAEGPFRSIDDYAGVHEMAASPDHARARAELAATVDGGLIEAKGGWSLPEQPGLGSVLGRCIAHSVWWFDVPVGFCSSALHAQAVWERSGARRQDGVLPAAYPDSDYETSLMIWDGDYERRMSPQQRRMLLCDRRYLRPALARAGMAPDVSSWHPELFFDFDDRRAELAEAGVRFVDHLDGARQELSEIVPAVGTAFHGEPSHWIYLPWRNVALHLPGPRALWRLRTDRNRHKVREAEQDAMLARTVGVVGMSVGSSAAFAVAQEGLCGAMRLADFDRLEITNLNRLSGSIVDLGSPKVEIAARRIAELDPYLPVSLYEDGVDATNVDEFVGDLDVVVEECDSLDVKLRVREAAARYEVPVLMETSDRGLLDVERYDLDPDRQPFHGLLGDSSVDELASLSTDDKVPYVLGILEPGQLSAKMAASMVEIDATTSSWPQLASDVALGSCLIAATIRRLFSSTENVPSGRARLDIGDVLDGIEEPTPEPWADVQVPPAQVEHPSLPERFTDAMVHAAGLAPSGGNMQPWRFEFTHSTFDVELAPRTQVGLDVAGRGSAVACGAALANAMAVAAIRSRLSHNTGALDLSLDLDRPDVVGRVHLGGETDDDWASLAPYITRRSTSRVLGPSTPLAPEVVETLKAASVAGGARCVYLPTHQLGDLVDLWAEADRVRYLTPRLHREMMSELRRPGIDPLDDGLDERTLELSASDAAKLPILRRSDVMSELDRLDLGRRLGDDTRKRLRESSGMLIVLTGGHTRTDYVRGGVGLQRMWLTATRLNLWLQPMSPVFGYTHTPEELAELVGPARAARLYRLSRMAYRQLGIDEDESFVLAARVHGGLPPSAVSRRRTPHSTVARQPARTIAARTTLPERLATT